MLSVLFAYSFGFVEFFISTWAFGDFKRKFQLPAFLIFWPFAFFGLLIRVIARLYLKAGYKLDPEDKKKELVKTGIYSMERHPGYVGYFMYSVSIQMIVQNYITAIIMTLVLWKNFMNRVIREEEALYKIFGKEYLEYAKVVKTNIPFMNDIAKVSLGISHSDKE